MQSPREIFDAACNTIAASLACFGFQYRPSKHSAVKMNGDLVFEIHFQSSFRNYVLPDEPTGKLRQIASRLLPFGDLAAFGSVTLIEHASVRSRSLKEFRGSLTSPWTVDDAVTGGQIGNLQLPARWVQFNMANPTTRPKVVRQATELIQTVALPYFDVFLDARDVIARLLGGSMPWTWEPSALEYVCCFGTRDQALQLLKRFTKDSPTRAAEYAEAVQRYKSRGIPEAWDSTAAERLAKAALILGLDDTGVEPVGRMQHFQ